MMQPHRCCISGSPPPEMEGRRAQWRLVAPVKQLIEMDEAPNARTNMHAGTCLTSWRSAGRTGQRISKRPASWCAVDAELLASI